MDFGLSEEQELLQETVRSFVDNECPPTRVREIFDAETGHDAAVWKGLCEIGLAGLNVPEDLGGAGLEALDLALVTEELGRAAVPGPFLGHALASEAIAHGGSDAQKQRWLPRLASGECIGTVALAEEAAWMPGEWTLTAADAKATGNKSLVPHASLADVIVIGLAGGGLALVERDAPGVSLAPFAGVDRTRPCYGLALDGAPIDVLPGGVAAAGRVRDLALVLLAADAFGGGWRLIQMTVDYLGQRQQFGMPLTQFQGIKHQLANLATELEPARALWWYAAHALDHIAEEAERSAAIAKAHITDRAMDIARECVELHGGIGFTWECDVQIWYKRQMFNRSFLGSPQLHRERSAALGGW
jgi:alkylation response protein AidB-like acyl-CoA dehydrogenase